MARGKRAEPERGCEGLDCFWRLAEFRANQVPGHLHKYALSVHAIWGHHQDRKKKDIKKKARASEPNDAFSFVPAERTDKKSSLNAGSHMCSRFSSVSRLRPFRG